MSKGTVKQPQDGTLYIGVNVDLKGALLIGGVVYLAARTAVRRELKRDRRGSAMTFVQNVYDAAKDGWSGTTDTVEGEKVMSTEEKKAEAKRLRTAGNSIANISSKMDVPESTIRGWLKDNNGTTDIPRQPNGGDGS